MPEQMTLQKLIEQKEKACPGYRDGYMMGHAVGQYEAILSILDVITNHNIVSKEEKENRESDRVFSIPVGFSGLDEVNEQVEKMSACMNELQRLAKSISESTVTIDLPD